MSSKAERIEYLVDELVFIALNEEGNPGHNRHLIETEDEIKKLVREQETDLKEYEERLGEISNQLLNPLGDI